MDNKNVISIKEGDNVYLLSTLRNGTLFPRKVHTIVITAGQTCVKFSRFPDYIDPPVPLADIVADLEEALRILEEVGRKKDEEAQNYNKWLRNLRNNMATSATAQH